LTYIFRYPSTRPSSLLIAVILQDYNGQDIGSAEIEGAGAELNELYKVIPEALMFSMGVDTSKLKKFTLHEHPTESVLAYAHFLQARREAYFRNFSNALIHLQRALQIDSSFAMTEWGIGEVKRLEGNNEEAKEWYRKAAELDPDHPRMAIVASQELRLLPSSIAERFDEKLMIGASYSKLYY
jgi:tetratricopeptide (TPR) repeat protein